MRNTLAAIAFVIAALPTVAQPVISPENYSPHSEYRYVRSTGNYMHPDGYPVTVIIVQDDHGQLFRVAMLAEDAIDLYEGALIEITPREDSGIWNFRSLL